MEGGGGGLVTAMQDAGGRKRVVQDLWWGASD